MRTGIKKNSLPVNNKAPNLMTNVVRSSDKPKSEEIIPIVTSYNDLVNYIESVWLVSIPKTSIVSNHAKDHINGLIISTSCHTKLEDYMNVYHLSNNHVWLHQNRMISKKMDKLKDGFILFLSESDVSKVSDNFYVTNVYGKRATKENGKHSILGIIPPPLILESDAFMFIKDHIPHWYPKYENSAPKDQKVILFHKEEISQDSDINKFMPLSVDMEVTDLAAERKRIYECVFDTILKMLYNNIDISIMAEDDVRRDIVDYLLPTLKVCSYTPTISDQMSEDELCDDELTVTKLTKCNVSTHNNGCLLYSINYLTHKFEGTPAQVYSQMEDHIISKIGDMNYDIYEGEEIRDIESHIRRIFDKHEMFDDLCIMAIAVIMDISIRIFTNSLVTQFNDSDTVIHIYYSDRHFEPLIESSEGDFYLGVTDIIDSSAACAISKRRKIIDEADDGRHQKQESIETQVMSSENSLAARDVNIASTTSATKMHDEASQEDMLIKDEADCGAKLLCEICGDRLTTNNYGIVNENFKTISTKVDQLMAQVNGLTDKLTAVELENTKLRTEVDKLHVKSNELEINNAKLAADVLEQRKENANLRQENEKLANAIKEEKSMNIKLLHENNELKSMNGTLKTAVEEYENALENVQIELEGIKQINLHLVEENNILKMHSSFNATNTTVDTGTQTTTLIPFNVDSSANGINNNGIECLQASDVQLISSNNDIIYETEPPCINPTKVHEEALSDINHNTTVSDTNDTTHIFNNSFAVEIAKYVSTVYLSIYKNNHQESKAIVENAVEEISGLIESNIHHILHHNVMECLVPKVNAHLIIEHTT